MMSKGCNVGNLVYTNATNTFPLQWEQFRELYNGEPLIVYYNNMTVEKGKCYITNPYGFNLQLCVGAKGERGSVINYSQSQVTCVPPPVTNADLDKSTIGFIIVILLVIISAIFIWRSERNNTMFG